MISTCLRVDRYSRPIIDCVVPLYDVECYCCLVVYLAWNSFGDCFRHFNCRKQEKVERGGENNSRNNVDLVIVVKSHIIQIVSRLL